MRTGIFLFDQVEVLDFAGPFEVFSLATRREDNAEVKLFEVITISESGKAITARNGLQVLPGFGFDDHPPLDLLIIPGGPGADEVEIHKPQVLDWIRSQAAQVQMLASVCTGAFLLAEAGLLNGLEATTHWMDTRRLAAAYPEVRVVENQKFVDQGRILTAAGISAGIQLSLHMIGRLHGPGVAQFTARRMEFDSGLDDLSRSLLAFRDARDWKQFHKPKDLALAISVEAAELLEAFLWKSDQEAEPGKIREELADVMAYVLLMADACKIDIRQALADKIKANANKYPVEKARGNARKYTDL